LDFLLGVCWSCIAYIVQTAGLHGAGSAILHVPLGFANILVIVAVIGEGALVYRKAKWAGIGWWLALVIVVVTIFYLFARFSDHM